MSKNNNKKKTFINHLKIQHLKNTECGPIISVNLFFLKGLRM